MTISPWAMLMTPIAPYVITRPNATKRRIEPRLRPMNKTSSIQGNLIASVYRARARQTALTPTSDLQLCRFEPLGGAEQIALGFAIGHVGNRNCRLLVGVDDLALSVR